MNKTSFLFISALLCFGCSDDEAQDAEAGEDPAEHACERAPEAGTAVDAAADSGDAPLLEVSDEPYTVTLPESGAGHAGFVKLEGPGELLLFVGSEAVVKSLVKAGSSDNLLSQAAPNEFCPELLPEHFDLALYEAADYVLSLGPATQADVQLMILETGEHGH